MFEKQKAEYILSKIVKYGGKALRASLVKDGDNWVVDVEIFEDEFNLSFKDIEVRFRRSKDGSS